MNPAYQIHFGITKLVDVLKMETIIGINWGISGKTSIFLCAIG